jgi:hypothetical protein
MTGHRYSLAERIIQLYAYQMYSIKSHRGINVDHGINVDQHSRPRNMCKYYILYLHLFRGFEC